MITLLFTVIFALLASLSAKIGIIYSLAKEHGVRGFSLHLMDGLASGFLLGTVFLILLPVEDRAVRTRGIFSLIALLLFLCSTGSSNPARSILLPLQRQAIASAQSFSGPRW